MTYTIKIDDRQRRVLVRALELADHPILDVDIAVVDEFAKLAEFFTALKERTL